MPAIPWPWRKDSAKETPNAPLSLPKVREEYDELVAQVQTGLASVPPPLLALTAFAVGSFVTVTATFLYTRYGRRLQNSEWITPDMFAKRRWVKGIVTTVGDADNFRLYHTPGLGWHYPFKFRRIPSTTKDLKDETLHIRIAGVDAPEAAHFGRPAQPYAAESLAFLRDTILGKLVYCQLLHRDQYSRIASHVANVVLSPRILPGAFVSGKSLSLEVLRAGWGTTYEQAGAEYGKWGKEKFLQVESEAKAARRGMWAKGTSAETPAEYKRRFASASSVAEAEAAKPKTKTEEPQKGWLRRLLGCRTPSVKFPTLPQPPRDILSLNPLQTTDFACSMIKLSHTLSHPGERITLYFFYPGAYDALLAIPHFPHPFLPPRPASTTYEINLSPTPSQGTGMFATARLRPGDLIISERPMLLLPGYHTCIYSVQYPAFT
ncbi:putative endonuclease LCL3 [Hypsizygus marmoreus]|uniref:Endonuclease LCL3 n=1 Tax=Hypsizygus marmoreus TaxID=39966 RepID=A0A369J6K9_HYPMA|nr:putative endonuclease LCL3 [Hypsizygus marmoreus]